MFRNQHLGARRGIFLHTHFDIPNRRALISKSCIFVILALFLATLPGLGQAKTATSIALAPISSPATYGSAVTMTATVSQTGSVHALRGSVTFTDTVGTTSRVLGVVQVQSAAGTAGQAVLVQRLGAIGSHSVTATFNPTAYFSGITSAPQAVTVTGLYPTVTSITGTGGSVGSWTLQATVSGIESLSLSPTGTVSLEDTSNGNYSLGTPSTLGTGTITSSTVTGTGSPISVGNAPGSVASGDFNGDGFTDIAVLNRGDSTISILLGDGSGGFTVVGTKPASGANAVAIAAADLDGDGNID